MSKLILSVLQLITVSMVDDFMLIYVILPCKSFAKILKVLMLSRYALPVISAVGVALSNTNGFLKLMSPVLSVNLKLELRPINLLAVSYISTYNMYVLPVSAEKYAKLLNCSLILSCHSSMCFF